METKSRVYYERLIEQERKNMKYGRKGIIIGAVLIIISIILYLTTEFILLIVPALFLLPMGIYQYSKANGKVKEAQAELDRLS